MTTTETMETQINNIIRKATEEVTAAVRANLLGEIGRIVEGTSRQKTGATTLTPISTEAGKVVKKTGGRKRVVDDAEVIDFVTKNPGKRTEEICLAFGKADRESVKRALHNARKGGFITSDGVKRAMTWSAAK